MTIPIPLREDLELRKVSVSGVTRTYTTYWPCARDKADAAIAEDGAFAGGALAPWVDEATATILSPMVSRCRYVEGPGAFVGLEVVYVEFIPESL